MPVRKGVMQAGRLEERRETFRVVPELSETSRFVPELSETFRFVPSRSAPFHGIPGGSGQGRTCWGLGGWSDCGMLSPGRGQENGDEDHDGR